jgi:hypothetical protein
MSDTADTAPTTQEATEGDHEGTGEDLAAEVAKWKAIARKHEDRAKANAGAAKELESVRQASMSDIEKAVAMARDEARAQALLEAGEELVDEVIRNASKDAGVDADVLLEGLDRRRFLGEDNKPDRKAIGAWFGRLVPKPDPGSSDKRFPDLGQGSRIPPHALNGDPLLNDLKSALGIS